MVKDLITDLTSQMTRTGSKMLKKKNPMTCPGCGKTLLVKQGAIPHVINVAGQKFITGAFGIVGSAIPAPDYEFSCPKCKRAYVMNHGPDIKRGIFKYKRRKLF